MSAPLMAMVLLAEPLQFDPAAVKEVIASFPASAKAKLHAIKNEGTSLQILFDDMKFAVVADTKPMALRDFAKEFAQPSGKAIEPMIAAHRAKLIVTCANAGKDFGEAVMSATIVHLLAVKLGALGKPLGGYWVSSERLCDWAEFTVYGDAVMPAFENDPETQFPTRYWVSVQMIKSGIRIGGETLGLRPFASYELDLVPIDWPLALVAERLVETVAYIFSAGPVLQNGDTLGVTNDEKFRLGFTDELTKLQMTLDADERSRGNDE